MRNPYLTGRYVCVRVDGDVVAGMFSPTLPGQSWRCREGLPDGAEFAGVVPLVGPNTWALLFRHDSFGEVPLGADVPELTPVFQTLYNDDPYGKITQTIGGFVLPENIRADLAADATRLAQMFGVPASLVCPPDQHPGRAALEARYPRESWMNDDEYARYLERMVAKEATLD